MDIEKAEYIINNYSKLLSSEEKMALRHTHSVIKLGDAIDNPAVKYIYYRNGWITKDKSVLALLINGFDNFQIQTAKRILEQNAGKVFFNNCPQCGKLARTPLAKQCRFCGNNWHYQITAKFRLSFSTKITNRGLFLAGEIVKGEISGNENFIDLVFAGINKKAKIKSIESIRKIENSKTLNLIMLQIDRIDEDEIQTIINNGFFFNPIDIFISI